MHYFALIRGDYDAIIGERKESIMVKMPTGCEFEKVGNLVLFEKNPKKHTKEQIKKIIKSITASGWGDPLVVCPETKEVLSGNGRLLAAKKMGLDEVPVVYAPAGMTEEQKARMVVASNKLVDETGYNDFLDELVKEFNLEEFMVNIEDAEVEEEEFKFDASIPQYEVKGENVSIGECFDCERVDKLLKEIRDSGLDEEEKRLLSIGAYRLATINYRKVAEYYAGKASDEMKGLMERMALVIIDYDNAIANGFTTLTKDLREMVDE